MVKIFDVSEGSVVINENCLLIPELKAIVDTYENPIPPLSFVHFMTCPFEAYWHLSEEQREEILLDDYPGDYTVDDEPIFKALKKLSFLNETESMYLLKNAKKGLRTLADYLGTAAIRDDERNGNFSTFQNALKSVAKISQEYRGLEKDVQEELKIRGNVNLGYDEI